MRRIRPAIVCGCRRLSCTRSNPRQYEYPEDHGSSPNEGSPVPRLHHRTVKGAVTVLLCPPNEHLTVYVPVPAPVFETIR